MMMCWLYVVTKYVDALVAMLFDYDDETLVIPLILMSLIMHSWIMCWHKFLMFRFFFFYLCALLFLRRNEGLLHIYIKRLNERCKRKSQMLVRRTYQSLALRNEILLEIIKRWVFLITSNKKEIMWTCSNDVDSMQENILKISLKSHSSLVT